MQGSMSILFWSIVVLSLVLAICALALQTLVVDYFNKSDDEARLVVFMYYGTFSRALLSMFEVTMGNWMPPCRALVENVSEWFAFFFVLHKLIIGLSVLGIINGVFIQETFTVARQDNWLMTVQKERLVRTHIAKFQALFDHLDVNHDHYIELEEFLEIQHEPRVRTWLSAMEFQINDVHKVFKMLDRQGDGKLTVDELVKGAAQLKGAARNLDIADLLYKVDDCQDALREMGADLSEMRSRQGAFPDWRSHLPHGKPSEMRST